MIEIGFTGTRQGMTIPQHAALVKIMLSYRKMTEASFMWHHGLCIGSDEQCHNLATIFDFYIFGHPPINEDLVAELTGFRGLAPAKGYIARNHTIVDSTEILIATPHELKEQVRSGTWATIRYAKKRGKRVTIINPYGNTYVYSDL